MLKKIRLEAFFDGYLQKKANRFVLRLRGKPIHVTSFAASGSWACQAGKDTL